ncbi:aminoglycoside adenylyltransferase domain-containing protein [Aliicoccus persicus]|uniref:Streptomycin 3-adenylyltransferase n=1 Tax=Aliicoccus persicus TaxID=930138 RepID=A0A662Z5I9_9STAP|nr:aminoglycoside adenylyltransferase domain-containing protein [Aliicoccus persicus]SEW17294.1 streptomycin 3-adenylyltransferase [Aliicoccus persicus]
MDDKIKVSCYLSLLENKLKSLLKDKLVGLYVHGSFAQGSFKWERSDIDILAVVDGNLSTTIKQDLLKIFRELKPHGPKKEIEISFLDTNKLKSDKHPYHFEFHYSPYWYMNMCENHWQINTNKIKEDPDLAGHIMNLRSKGIVLLGPAIEDVFPKITEKDFIDSLNYDESDAPVNIVDTIMNLCRSQYYYTNSKLVSKLEGLKWMMNEKPYMNEFLEQIHLLYENDKVEIPESLVPRAIEFKEYILIERNKTNK